MAKFADIGMPTDHAEARLAAVWNWAKDVSDYASLEHDADMILWARHVLQLIYAQPILPTRAAYQRMTDEEYAELQYENGMAAD
jgi:hypothetical protein